jgi:mercuric ion transport protein
MWKAIAAAVGAVSAAVGSTLCCAGPLVAVALGASGAGLAGTFEPLRPYFLGATAVSLGGGFWVLRREERRACQPGRMCATPWVRRTTRVALWAATALALLLATFPTWSAWVFH